MTITFRLLAILIAFSASLAHANLERIEYTDLNEAQAELMPAYGETIYIANSHNSTAVEFFVSTSTDEYVEMTWSSTASEDFTRKLTSDVVSFSDTEIIGGTEMYGATLIDDKNLPEGKYNLKVVRYRSNGTVRSELDYQYIVDRSPPLSGDLGNYSTLREHWDYLPLDDGSWLVQSIRSSEYIYVDGVSDELSGTSHVVVESLETIEADGSKTLVRSDVPMEHNPGSDRVEIEGSKVFRHEDSLRDQLLTVAIYDRAGNVSRLQQEITADGLCQIGEWYAIESEDPNQEYGGFSGYKEYQDGVEVGANPFKIIYRVPIEYEYLSGNQLGSRFAPYDGKQISRIEDPDQGYVFHEFEFTKDRSWIRVNKIRHWNCDQIRPNVVLGGETLEAPSWVSRSYLWESDSTAENPVTLEKLPGLIDSSHLPGTITAMRVEAEPRPYEQLVTMGNVPGTCTIPAGETECHLPLDIRVEKDTIGYFHGCCRLHGMPETYTGPIPDNYGGAVRIRSVEEPSLVSTVSHPIIFWNDLVLPEIDVLAIENDSLRVTYRTPGWGMAQWRHAFRPEIVTIDVAGTTKQLSNKTWEMVTDSNQHHDMLFSLDGFPSGEATITVSVSTNTGSTVSKSITHILDNDGPDFEVRGLSGHIESTSDAMLLMREISYLRDPVVRLSGGPNVNDMGVALSPVAQEPHVDGEYLYALNFPIMYPRETEAYTLHVTGEDRFGNTNTVTHSFFYSPPTVGLSYGDTAYLPDGAPELRDGLGDPAIQSNVVKIDGANVSASYPLWGFVDETASGPITINGVEVQPGETIQVAESYPFGSNGSKILLPMTIPQGFGSGDVLIYSAVADMPMLAFSVSSYKPMVAPNPDSSTSTVMFRHYLSFAKDAGGVCVPMIDTETNRLTAMDNIFGNPVCLIQWPDSLQPGRINYDKTRNKLALVPEEAREYTVPFTPVIPNQAGEDIKFPAFDYTFTATEAVTDLTYEASEGVVDRGVEEARIRLNRPDYCEITEDQQKANQYPDQYCVAEFTKLPTDWFRARYYEVSRTGTLDTDDSSYTVEWRIGRVGEGGAMVWFEPQSHTFQVQDPQMPVIDMLNGRIAYNEVYSNPGSERFRIINFRNLSEYPVDISIKTSNGHELSYPSVTANSLRILPGIDGPLWTHLDHTVEVSYSERKDIAFTKQLKSVVMPEDNLRLNMVAPYEASDLDPLPVTINFGKLEGGEYQYRPETMGDWQIYLAERTIDGQTLPVTAKQTLSGAELQFTVPADVLAAGTQGLFKLVAIAELKSPSEYAELERFIVGRTQTIRIIKGTPLDGWLTAREVEGPEPLTGRIRLEMDRASRYALGDVVWERRQLNTSWETIPGSEDRLIVYPVMPEGTYEYRARMTNKNTSVVSHTDPVRIWAYAKLGVDVDGPEFAALGDKVTLKITASENGYEMPHDAFASAWTYRDPYTYEVFNGEGYTLDLSNSGERGTRIPLQVKARHSDADPESPRSWFYNYHYVLFDNLKKPYLSVYLPFIMELGKTYNLKANVRPSWGYLSSNYEVLTEWELPNGDIIQGTEISVNMDDIENADLVGTDAEISVRAWVKGHKSETLNEVSRSVKIWRYTWPDFTIRVQNNYDQVPATITATAQPASSEWYRSVQGADLSYKWDLPSEAEIQAENRDTVTFNLPIGTGGEFPITVEITDNRGNRTTVTEVAVLGDTPPYDVTIMAYPDNKYWRAPLQVYARSTAANGHIKDAPEIYEWFVDGQKVSDQDRYMAYLPVETAGTHEITLRLSSKFGMQSEETITVTAYPNKVPSCEMTTSSGYGDSLVVYAKCSDQDGSIKGYSWSLDGVKLGTTGYMVTVYKKGQQQELSVTATDDAGGSVTQSMTIPSSP